MHEKEGWNKRGLDQSKLEKTNEVKSHWRHVRTRLYFTSASHMYSLLNVIKFGLEEIPQTQKNSEKTDQNEKIL